MQCLPLYMKFLVVAATVQEISPLLRFLDLEEAPFVQSEKMDILITGVGMTATAFSIGHYVAESYSFILNVGIAGAFNPDIKVGELVCVTSDSFSELGAEDDTNFITIDQLGFGKSTFYAGAVDQLLSVSSITVNTVHGRYKSILEVIDRINPDIESMEGAAVIYCANRLQVPVYQVRCISNLVESRNKDNWNIPLAIKNLNDWLIPFIEKQP